MDDRGNVAFSAVRITPAVGAGCLLTVRHDARARANASSTRSWSVSWSPTLTRDGAEALIPEPAVELREVQSLGAHTYSTHNFGRPPTWFVVDHGGRGFMLNGRRDESDRAPGKSGRQSGVDRGHQVVVPFGSTSHADRAWTVGPAAAAHPAWARCGRRQAVCRADEGARGSDRRAA